MRLFARPGTAAVPLLLVALAASACRSPDVTATDDTTVPRPSLATAAELLAHPGRTLAANCFQCHGTNGFAGELKIAGQSATEITSSLDKFRASDPRLNIMNVHALGYTPEQIALIADYFAKQGG